MIKRRIVNRDAVIEKAVAMADEAGKPEAVTLTLLADALGIRVPSLYNHIEGLNDLYDAMAVYGTQQLIAQIRVAAVGKVGRDALQSMAIAYRQFAWQHPGIYPLTLRAPGPEDKILVTLSQELLHLLLLVLASFGLQGEQAIHAVRGIRSLLHGFVALEAAEGFKMPLDRNDSFEHLVNTFLDGLARSRLPEKDAGTG